MVKITSRERHGEYAKPAGLLLEEGIKEKPRMAERIELTNCNLPAKERALLAQQLMPFRPDYR